MKFGGTSVADLDRIRRVARLVAAEPRGGVSYREFDWRVRPTVVGVALLVTYAVLDVIFTMRTLGAEGGPATVWVNYCLLLALPLLAGALCLIYGTRLRRRAAPQARR